MDPSKEISSTEITVKVAHDLQRQILEMTSLLRVINNYYKKKKKSPNSIKNANLRENRRRIKITQL